jgi:dTMP kinase
MSKSQQTKRSISLQKDHLPLSLEQDRPGKLIVIEGADGSGRSTQISLLSEWLEWHGFAVRTMGLKRSKLLASDLEALARSNEMQLMTRLLLYATDFYDQLENNVIPALRAGFVVLADRYSLTPICRAMVRGVEADYIRSMYRFAPEPDLTVRLEVTPNLAFHRLFSRKSSLNHWEFGGDLNLEGNVYESFIGYQSMLQTKMSQVGQELEYLRIDGTSSVRDVNDQIRSEISTILGIEDIEFLPSDSLRSLWSRE